MSATLYDLRYLPSISWFASFVKCEDAWIEREENFVKSSYRNRCEIAGAAGRLSLSIPVSGGRDHHRLYKDTRIAYHLNWQKNHWHSIRTAYGSAPFYEFYFEKFQSFYEKEYPFLFDFNLELLEATLAVLHLKTQFRCNETYEEQAAGKIDLRSRRRPKDAVLLPPYHQVFQETQGFIPDICILDLIFNMGPDAGMYLSGLNSGRDLS